MTEPRQQFGVDAVETAIAEDADDIATLRVLGEVRNDGVGVRQIRRLLAGSLDVGHQFFGIQPFLRRDLLESRNLGDDHRVRIRKG